MIFRKISPFVVLGISVLSLTINTFAQTSQHALSFQISIEKELEKTLHNQGRLYLFLSEDSIREPRTQTWPSPRSKTYIFALNINDLKTHIHSPWSATLHWSKTPEWNLDKIPEGTYFGQVLWDQNTDESNINAPGNFYSEKQKVWLNKDQHLTFSFNHIIEDRKVDEHPLVRYVQIKSDTLSNWWGRDQYLKASVLLPRNYTSNKTYPIRYNVSGYGGRYDRINNLTRDSAFMSWWYSDDAPEIISVFLDGEGPFGDSYQLDSENSGPYGTALTLELIPYIENQFRGTRQNKQRYVDGCSTGGWVSLALQLIYPDLFDGVFSYSPDAIAFDNYQLINIYTDENAYVNEYGYERPVMRDILGEPMLSLREFIHYENVLGSSNTYLNSGGQFSAHTALYSPQGKNNLPQPLFDPITGVIDHAVAEHWKKYDLKRYAKAHWTEIGPKIQDKIYIWMGDMDHFYLNSGTRSFDHFIQSTTNPKSNAVIEYSPMQGHCAEFSHKTVLLKIKEKLMK